MRFYILNNFGMEKELPLQSSKILAGNFKLKFCIENPDENLEISINGEPQTINFDLLNVEFPFEFDKAGNCNIQINRANSSIHYKIEKSLHYNLDERFEKDIKDFERHCRIRAKNGILTFENLISSIQHGDINLVRIIDPLTGLAEDKIINDILRAMPYALGICSKPHQHLRMEQKILDVEFVKKITSGALRHLAAHSEHWKAKTINGLIPDRLLAQTFEDDLNIYENIFFRMVIQKSLFIVENKEELWRQAEAQKSAMIAWEHYGGFFGDYNRMQILKNIIPKFDLLETMMLTEEQEKAKLKLDQAEHHLLSISSSNFYNNLDKNKRLVLPIFPTNILTMDSRYREIYILWNKLQHIEKEISSGADNALQNIDSAYFLYVFILMIYGLNLTGLNFKDNSCVKFSEDNFDFECSAESDFFEFKFTREQWNKILYIKIFIKSKKVYRLKNPLTDSKALKMIEEKIKEFPNQISIDEGGNILTIKNDFEILNSKELKNIFKQDTTIWFKKNDKIWRSFLTESYSKRPSQNSYTIALVPITESLGDDEISFCAAINNFFDSIKNLSSESFSGADTTIFAMPYDVHAHFIKEIKNSQIENRIINYGDRFSGEDSKIFGNYKFGLIPISMIDINSIQRLIKVVKIHLIKSFLDWNFEEKVCPNCYSKNIIQKENLWKCNECNIIWGDTQCTQKSCKKIFKWVKPAIELKKQQSDLMKVDGIDLTLLKENIFGSTTITDFEFDTSSKNYIRYIPRCPHCGNSECV